LDIREFTWADYEAVYALWDRLHMTKPNIDNRVALAGCLERNPGLFLVAVAPDGHPAGTVLGTFDGRRGYLYHVAVDPAYRRQGIGRALMTEIMDRLRARGAVKITLRVARENQSAIAFYRSVGLDADEHVLGMSIEY
jgi:ribosomal protein S18 acetylase RimI-like enzyme